MQESHIFHSELPPSAQSLRIALGVAGRLSIRLGGSSMSPVIRDNDTVLLERCSEAAIRKGDIVLFAAQDVRLIGHRVIRIMDDRKEKRLITKGDTVVGFDQAITSEMIIGKITAVSRNDALVSLDKVLWFKVLKVFHVNAPDLAIAFSFMLLTVKRAANNLFSGKKNE